MGIFWTRFPKCNLGTSRNAAPRGAGAVTVTDAVAAGFLWSESVGWINLGDGSPERPPHYSNESARDFGVNHDGKGGLYGLAWGEAIGWINFDTSAANGSQVRIGVDGQMSGYAWSESVGWINFDSGQGVVMLAVEVEGEGAGEGAAEGAEEGQSEGVLEGEGAAEGAAEGEGLSEGEGAVTASHSGDQNGDGIINLTELLRVIQFFNFRGFHCATPPEVSEDGYLPGAGGGQGCAPHASDYAPQDWEINLTELLRLIQFFNLRGYHPCPGLATEDGYCPGF